jgi:type IV pilus assembly protein PilW
MTTRDAARREAGMSLVEVMVGMAIGLIGIVIITHLYLTNEDYKRSTTGAGTAQTNGAIALYTIERDLRQVGYGFNHSGAFGCSCVGAGCSPVRYYYNGNYSSPPAGSSTLPAVNLLPVVIKKTAGQPDSITVVYSTAGVRGLPTTLDDDMSGPSSDMTAAGTGGYNVGDMLAMTQGATCSLLRITNIGGGSKIMHTPSGAGGSKWNPPSGSNLLPTYTKGAYLFDIGHPVWRTYSVATRHMTLLEVIVADTGPNTVALDLIDNIVDLRAQYGVDTSGNGAIESTEWTDATPANVTQWGQLLAVRLGVLARSPNYVKPLTPGADCDATTAAPTWSGGTFDALDFATTSSEARCYKYRSFETIVPLRNMIWRPA